MSHAIAWFLEMLLRMVLPTSGRHRSVNRARATGPDPDPGLPAAAPPRDPVPALRGEDVALVRPYRVAHEEREEALRRWRCRRTLVLAVHGGQVDLGAYLRAEEAR